MMRRLSSEINKARALLKCKAGASQEEIRAAFRKAALRVHPDQRGNASDFVELCAAAELLSERRPELLSEQKAVREDPWQEALARVKFGPAFELADDGFPDAFEMEERNLGSDGPLLKLVHGRFEFGDVRQVDGGLELHLEGRVVRASRRGRDTMIDDLRLVRSAPSPVVFGFGGFASSFVIDGEGDKVYGLYESKTPGVESMVWHRGAVLATVSRAWMPPDRYWFPFFRDSRSFGYGSDGHASSFYFERRRSSKTRRLVANNNTTTSKKKRRLDPAVCVFTAAYETLDRYQPPLIRIK